MRKKYTKRELLEKLKNWAEVQKRSPSSRDIDKDELMPSVRAYITHFGTFNKAKELAGLELFEYNGGQVKKRKKKFTNEDLLEKLKKWAEIHKKSPSSRDIDKDESMPSVRTYIAYFGSFNKAKELLGLEISRFTDEKLLEKLKEWVRIHETSPSQHDIDKDESMPSARTYITHFGSFNKAKELLGLEIRKKCGITYTNEDLLEKLKKWEEVHKKSPSARDILEDKSMPAPHTYTTHFGSFNKAKELAGLETFVHDSDLNYVEGLLRKWKEGWENYQILL